MDYTWTIADIRAETHNVSTLVLTMDGTIPSYVAGQYLTIKLPGCTPIEGKAYSISSAPCEEYVTVTIKEMGSYSSKLLAKKKGETLTTSAPYGFFYPEDDDAEHLVFLAGGIGITPCISIIKQLCHNKDPRSIYLLYSNQTQKDVVFHTQLTELAAQHTAMTYQSYLTRERIVSAPHQQGHIDIAQVLAQLPHPNNTTFFLCGSMHFTRDFWKKLREEHILQENIYTEGFF